MHWAAGHHGVRNKHDLYSVAPRLTARSSRVHYYVSAVYVSSCLSVHTCRDTPWPRRVYTDSPHRPPGQRIHVYCSCSSIFSSSNQSRSLFSSAPVILFYLHYFVPFRLLAPLFSSFSLSILSFVASPCLAASARRTPFPILYSVQSTVRAALL